jgi:hypothetical protein
MRQPLPAGNPLAMSSPTDTVRETMRAQPRKPTLLFRLFYQAEIRRQLLGRRLWAAVSR